MGTIAEGDEEEEEEDDEDEGEERSGGRVVFNDTLFGYCCYTGPCNDGNVQTLRARSPCSCRESIVTRPISTSRPIPFSEPLLFAIS